MSKCVICTLGININFKVSTESTRGDENDEQTEFLLGSQNNRIAFQTFCTYFKISSREWEKLCDNFNVGAGSKNSSNSQEYGKRKKLQDTSSEINEEFPVPFCDECLALVNNLSELDKMLKMIQSEVSKMFSNLLTVILTRKNENDNNCKFTSDNPHSSNSTPHTSDLDEVFGSEIIRLRNCIYEQYRPRLILSDYLKNKSPSQLTSEGVKYLTKSTIKNKDVKSCSPLHQNLKRKRRMRKTTSLLHPQNAVVNVNEIVDLDQHQNQDESSTTNKTNYNFTTENPTSPNSMEIDDDDSLDEDPLSFNQEEQEQVLENSQFHPKVINYSSTNNNNSTHIKIEPSETTCTATSNDCESPTKSRKAKNKAVLKIKHEIEELSTLDINLNLNKNPNKFDSDGEYDDDGSEYESSCDENENEVEEEDDNDDWRASFGYSTAPKRKRGRPSKVKNKKNKNQHQNSDSDMDSQMDEIKSSKSRPAGARNKKTIELQQQRESKEETNPDNNDKNKIGLDEQPSLVFFVKQQTCEQYEKEDGTSFFRCGSCGFTTSWRHSLLHHVDVFHSERKLQCIYCRGGKYSITTFARHMKKCHGEKRRKHVVIPCGPNLFYYNKRVFEKTESGFKCLHDECHQVFEECIQEIPTTTKLTTISEIEESNANLNPDCDSSQNPQGDNNNVNNENNNSNQDAAQIQTATENETQQEEQVEESEKDKEEEMTLIKGTEFIIEHINLVHIRKCNVDPSIRQKIPSKKSCGPMCELCGRSFRTSYFLKRHVTIKHSEERPWICETCGLSFKIKDGLDKHQKIHNIAQEVFACTINGCEKTFKTKRYLRRHMSSGYHIEGKDYTCTICEEQGIIKKYNQSFGLVRHMRSHGIGKEKTQKCPECFKAFYEPSEVRQHLIHCPVSLGLQPKPVQEEEETNENENKRRRKK